MDASQHFKTGRDVRLAARNGALSGPTAGYAPDHLQGNVVILPRRDAGNFLLYCANNPKPCPLIGLAAPGDPRLPTLGNDIDIRTDVPLYRVHRHGRYESEVSDIGNLWQDDFVTFVIGCSFTFEAALEDRGFPVRHIELGRNAPMFRTTIETVAGGPFAGPLVVTMRPYRSADIPQVFDICAQFPQAHGTPVYWGDPAGLGISDLQAPDFGDAVPVHDDETPVFWACGVTPQVAIETAKPEFCITHSPGHMLVTDIASSMTVPVITGMADLSGASST